jgi:hypothetical protein
MGTPQRCSFVLILVTVAIIVQSSNSLFIVFGCKGKDNPRNVQGIGWGWSKPNLQPAHYQFVSGLFRAAVLQRRSAGFVIRLGEY